MVARAISSGSNREGTVVTKELDLLDIQGNVIRAYGRFNFPVARYVFLRINNGDKGRAFVGAITEKVTTAVNWGEGDHPVQKAWLEHDVPQCGYCQPGFIMATVKLLQEIPNPTDEDIDEAMIGNICRCGTYQRIRKAIHRTVELKKQS